VSANLAQRIAWDRVLREVSLVIPSDVTLLSLTMTAPTTASAAPGAAPGSAAAQGFVIQGTAFSYDSVARLLSRLALVPDLSNVTLTSTGSGAAPGSSGSSSAQTTGGVQFNITAAVKGAPAPPPAAAPVAPASTDTTTGSGA
jgi:Tfp pilus assembly protein PilN